MRATPVETAPGGLLDLLVAADAGRPGAQLLRAGHAREAAAALAAEPRSPLQAAWWHVAEHTALLALPDGGALPYLDPIDERPTAPVRPPLPDREHPDYPACWALTQLVAGLRDLRGMLPPLSSAEVSPVGDLVDWGAQVISAGRAELGPAWPALGPHLDLATADLAARAGRHEEAWDALDRSRTGFERVGDTRGVALSALVAGDWHACPFASPLTWGLSLAQPVGEDGSLPESAETAERLAGPDAAAATRAYDEAARHYAGVGDGRGVAHVAWRRAFLAARLGDPAAAAALAEDAAAALQHAGDDASALLARAHGVLAALADGRLPDPVAVAGPVVAWGRGTGSLSHAIGIGRIVARVGRVWGSGALRRCELSLSASEVAAAVWDGLGRPASRSQALADQAHALRVLGATRPAVVALDDALAAAMAALPPAGHVDVRWTRAALLAADLYNVANAAADVAAMDRARRRLTEITQPLRGSTTLGPEEIFLAEQILTLEAQLGQEVIGLVYRAQEARDDGDAAASAALFAQAEAAAAGADPDEEGQQRAMVLAYQHRLDEAAACYRPWLAGRLAQIDGAVGPSPTPAAAALARQLRRQLHDQALFFSVRCGDLRTAREQLAALQTLGDPWWDGLGHAWEHEEVVARLHEAEGDLPGAAAAFARAVAAAEAVRADLRRDDLKVGFGSDRVVQQVYRGAARVALRRREQAGAGPDRTAHGWSALRLLELGRSRALTDLLAQSHQLGAASGLPADLLAAWRGAQAEVALCRDRLAAAVGSDVRDDTVVATRRAALTAAEAVLDARTSALRAADPRFWSLAAPAGAAPAADLERIPAALAPDEAVLVYSIDRPDFLACGLTADGLVAATWSREERRVDALARALVRGCATGGEWRDAATDLAAVLLDPVAAALAGATRVHVVASGPTLGVPFGVLPWRGQPLGETAAVSVLPSLSAFRLLGADPPAQGALCVGDPAGMAHRPANGGGPVVPPALPGAAAEARAVARLHGAAALVGDDATEAAVRDRLPTAGVVHLATHGLIDAESPLASSVLLAHGEQLTVAELLSLRLPASLVVLSACHTGAGRPLGGDELLGLGRALLAGGARSAVVSLWPVDDLTTAVLMVRFHTHLVGGVPRAEALWRAARWVRRLTPDQLAAEYALLVGRPAPASAGDQSRLASRTRDLAPESSAPGVATTPSGPDHPNRWAPFVLVGR